MIIDPSKRLFYTDIKLPGREPFSSYDLDQPAVLTNLATVNIFVGANNSGKSRFLRTLFASGDYSFKTNLFGGEEFRVHLRMTKSGLSKSSVELCQRLEPSPCLLDRHLANGFYPKNQNFGDQVRTFVSSIPPIAQGICNERGRELNHEWVGAAISEFAVKLSQQTHGDKFNPSIDSERRFYIPILRGMRPLGDDANRPGVLNSYYKRSLQDYFSNIQTMGQANNNSPYQMFTGLELYQRLHSQLLGEPEDRDAVRKFEEFLSSRFFDGKPIALIPRTGTDVVHIKIGDEPQLPIYNLGDGLQNLIIISYEMFNQKGRCLFFIEEPDISMHPGMQRALLDVMSEFSRHQYFLTTHSNHLLEMSPEFKDTSIYLFTKKAQANKTRFSVKQASSPDLSVLKVLGVRNSSVFLTNATIWVEGVTDRLYLRAYLKKYFLQLGAEEKNRPLQEDYHYSYVEYQGSNLTHWTFDNQDQSSKIKASFLCARSFLIADGDVSDKGTRREDYSAMLGDRFQILECKEIENLLPAEVLKELTKDEFARAGKDANSIAYETYCTSKEGLGSYLDKLLGKNCFASDSGTIRSKVNFCEKAVEIMARKEFRWELTPPLKELCKKIHQFVAAQNT